MKNNLLFFLLILKNYVSGPSMATETTDVSMSLYSLNSTIVSQPEGEYVNVIAAAEQQTAK